MTRPHTIVCCLPSFGPVTIAEVFFPAAEDGFSISLAALRIALPYSFGSVVTVDCVVIPDPPVPPETVVTFLALLSAVGDEILVV